VCFAAKCVGLEFVSTFTFTFELHKNDDSFAVPQPSFHFVQNNCSIGLISGELASQGRTNKEWSGKQDKNFHYSFFHTQPKANKREKCKFSCDFSWVTNIPFQLKIFRPTSKSTNSCWCLSYPCSTGKQTLSVLFSNSKNTKRVFSLKLWVNQDTENIAFFCVLYRKY